jgi:hypothetical protein
MTTKYTKDHEYIRVDGDVGTVGITDYAQQQLGDVVFVELPAKGKKVTRRHRRSMHLSRAKWWKSMPHLKAHRPPSTRILPARAGSSSSSWPTRPSWMA